jgi:hypothetical protein
MKMSKYIEKSYRHAGTFSRVDDVNYRFKTGEKFPEQAGHKKSPWTAYHPGALGQTI